VKDFDPYYKWLSIPPDEQPPDHYRLLGVRRFEADADVIAAAADRYGDTPVSRHDYRGFRVALVLAE